MSVEDRAAEYLETIEKAMREARDQIRTHDGDGDAQALASAEPVFRAVHALWGWAIATGALVQFLRDDLLRLENRIEELEVERGKDQSPPGT